MNLQIKLVDCNNKALAGRKVLFTPTKSPEITSSYLTTADSYQFTSSAIGEISASIVASKYTVYIANPKPVSTFYLQTTEESSSLMSGSAATGSAQGVVFDLIYLVKDPFAVKKVTLTPYWNYAETFSGSIVAMCSTSSITDATGSCTFDALVPTIYQVDCIGKVTTTFYISVPPVDATEGDLAPYWNAKDLVVVKPAKGISVKLNNADSSYVLTVSSSDARYAFKGESSGTGVTDGDSYNISASWASSSLSASAVDNGSGNSVIISGSTIVAIADNLTAFTFGDESGTQNTSNKLLVSANGFAVDGDNSLTNGGILATDGYISDKLRVGGLLEPENALDVTGNISCSVITASLFNGTASIANTASYISNAQSASYIAGVVHTTGDESIAGVKTFGNDLVGDGGWRLHNGSGFFYGNGVKITGNGSDNIDITPTPNIKGITVNDHLNVIGDITASTVKSNLTGTASWATNATTATVASAVDNKNVTIDDSGTAYFDVAIDVGEDGTTFTAGELSFAGGGTISGVAILTAETINGDLVGTASLATSASYASSIPQNLFINSVTASSGIRVTSGSIGIGTISPLAALHIIGTMGAGIDGSDVCGIRLTNSPNGVTWRVSSGLGGVSHATFAIGQNGVNPYFTIGPTGNVGIGKNAPVNKLDVVGNISCSVITASLFNGTASYADIANGVNVTSGIAEQNYSVVMQSGTSLYNGASFAYNPVSTTLTVPIVVGDLTGTASWATNVVNGSGVVDGGSYNISASYASQSLSASWAPSTPSDVAISASWASQSLNASHANYLGAFSSSIDSDPAATLHYGGLSLKFDANNGYIYSPSHFEIESITAINNIGADQVSANGITGSLLGTASWATNAINSNTASHLPADTQLTFGNTILFSEDGLTIGQGDVIIDIDANLTAANPITASLNGTASYAVSASYVSTAASATTLNGAWSGVTSGDDAYIQSEQFGESARLTYNQASDRWTISGDTVSMYNVSVDGTVTGNVTGSLFGTASWATNALTASHLGTGAVVADSTLTVNDYLYIRSGSSTSYAEIYVAPSAAPTVAGLFIVPPVNSTYLQFGRSGKIWYSMDFNYVSRWENVPGRLGLKTDTLNTPNGAFVYCVDGPLYLMSQNSAGNISAPNGPNYYKTFGFTSGVGDTDTYKRATTDLSAFIFVTTSGSSGWHNPHTNWNASTTTVMSLDMSGSLWTKSNVTSSIIKSNGYVANCAIKTANYTLTDNDYTVIFSGSAHLTASLPSATTAKGQIYNIKNVSDYYVYITGSEKVDGLSSRILSVKYENITVQSCGTLWNVI